MKSIDFQIDRIEEILDWSEKNSLPISKGKISQLVLSLLYVLIFTVVIVEVMDR